MEVLNELNSKVNLLLKRYAMLEAENKKLKATIEALSEKEKHMVAHIASLQDRMVSVNLNGTVTDDSEKAEMRKQLDILIGDIDRILNTLND
jgi:soluble cytochrome b562